MINKKALTPVIAVALLLIVAVIAVVAFQGWFLEFQSDISVEGVSQNKKITSGIDIAGVDGNILYISNSGDEVELNSIKLDNNECQTNATLDPGITEIDISNCLNETSDNTPSITLVSDSTVIKRDIAIDPTESSGSTSSSGTSASLDCSTLNGGDWVYVEGNQDLGTEDFCVMKYETKFESLSGKTQQVTFKNWQYDTATGNMNIVSKSEFEPIALITQSQARNACESLGQGYHLITNAEWTTIARIAENNPSNWADGNVGSMISSGGGLYRGNVNLVDSASCNQGYMLSSDVSGNNCLAGTRNKRTLNISGELIWDLSGNVNEVLNDTCSQSNFYSYSNWVQWSDTNLIDYEKTNFGPLNSYTNINGVGEYRGCTSEGNMVVRGMAYLNANHAGLYSIFLTYTPSTLTNEIGFRCTYSP